MKRGLFCMSNARPLNKRFARRLTMGIAFIKTCVSQSYHRDYFARWFWRMCSWFNKMCSLGSRGHFFVIDTDGSQRRLFNETRSAEEKELLTSTREHVYFILGILRTDLWNQGTKYVVCQKKKKTLTCSPQKRSRPALTYQELLLNFIFPLYLDNSAYM